MEQTGHRLFMTADLHYAPGLVACNTRMCADSIKKLLKIENILKDADIRVNLGDLINGTHDEKTDYAALNEVMGKLSQYGFYHVIGNHDAFALDKGKIIMRNGEYGSVYSFIKGDVKYIVLDANFTSENREYTKSDDDWTDTVIPPKQLEWLKDELGSCDGAVIFCHQNLDERSEYNPHVVKNSAEVRAILEKSGKVKYVFQGHCHSGYDSVINGINYHTLPAMCERGDIPYCVASVNAWDDIEYEDFCEKL